MGLRPRPGRDYAVVDPHLHVWDTNRLRYPWLAGFPLLNRSFLMADFDQARGGLMVEQLVFVQAECEPAQHLLELSWVQSLANQDQRISGLVPWVNVEAGQAICPTLDLFKQDPRVKGVRRLLFTEADPRFCLQNGFVQGVQELGARDLHFELCLRPDQFPAAMELIERCPQTRFVLDHIGNPDIPLPQSSV
jgi:L-fuconolactonase